MFNLCFATNVLFKLSKLHFSLHQWHGSRFAWPCLPRGKPLGPPVHMFNLCFSTYVLLKLSKLHFNLHQWHGTHHTQPACQRQAPWTSKSSHFSGIHRIHWNKNGIKQTKVEILIYLSQFLKLCKYIHFSLLSLPFSHNVYSSTLPLKFNFK